MPFTPNSQKTTEQIATEAAERRAEDRRTAEIVAAIAKLERTTQRLPLYFLAWSIILGIVGGLLYALFVMRNA